MVWRKIIHKNPAPWGELIIPNRLSIVFPSAEMRKIDDFEHVARFYAMTMQYFLDLMGTERSQIEERVVFDKEINIGNSHKYLWFVLVQNVLASISPTF